MHERLAYWTAEARRLWRIADMTTPVWLRLMLAAGAGAIAAVFLGWVDTHGDAIKVYMALVGVVVASLTSYVSGRVISEHGDRRTTRRKLSSARIRILMLEFGLRQLQSGIPAEVIDGEPLGWVLDPETAVRLMGYMQDAALTAEERPDFDQILERDEDVATQVAVLSIFRQVSAMFSKEEITPESMPMRNIVARRVCSADGHKMLDDQIERLRQAREKLDALIADL